MQGANESHAMLKPKGLSSKLIRVAIKLIRVAISVDPRLKTEDNTNGDSRY